MRNFRYLIEGSIRIVAPVAATCRNREKRSSSMARIAVHPERVCFAMGLEERLKGTSSGGESFGSARPANEGREGVKRDAGVRSALEVSIPFGSKSNSVAPAGSLCLAWSFSLSLTPKRYL